MKTESKGGVKKSLLRGRRIGVYPGQYYDQETGLHYNYFRYYNPQTGRYITPDPIGLEGGINLFAYTGNNSINAIDPFGLDWIEYTGQTITLYGGNLGNRANVKKTCGATSGLTNFQFSFNQPTRDFGPIPEGNWRINLVPDPTRVAIADPNTGDILINSQGGIEQIPTSFTTRGGITYIYPEWGAWRARLQPRNVPKSYGRGPFYLHDSHKGYTHGCVETCSDLYNSMTNYRSLGNNFIDVRVRYTTTSTYGGTYRP